MNDTSASRPGRLRRYLRRSLYVVVAIVALLGLLYLLRRPLFESRILAEVESLASEALGGKVEIEAIDGNWLTHISLRGVSLAGGDVVRTIDDGKVDVALAPLRLARGDFSGIRSVRAQARAITVDLSKTPEAAAESATTGPIDFAAITRLMPEGGAVEIDTLELIGVDATTSGIARLAVEPGSGASRSSRLTYEECEAEASVGSDGRVRFRLASDGAARWLRLFVRDTGAKGGRLEAEGVVRAGATFGGEARLSVRDLLVQDGKIARIELQGGLDGERVSISHGAIASDGVTVDLRDVSCSLADILPTLAGAVQAEVRDLSPYASLLPRELVELLPLTGSVKGVLRDRRAVLAPSTIRAAGFVLAIRDGTLPLASDSLDRGDVGFDLRLAEPRRVPASWGERFRPLAFALSGRLRNGRVDGTLESVLAADGQMLELKGKLGASIGAATVLRPELVCSGTLLREFSPLKVAGTATIRDDAIEVTDARFEAKSGGIATLSARVPIGGENPLAGTSCEVVVDRLDVEPLRRLFAPNTKVGGRVDAKLTLRPGTEGSLEIDADMRGLTSDPSVRLRTTATADADGVSLSRIDIESVSTSLRAKGRLRGATLAAMLSAESQLSELALELDGTVQSADLSRLGLERHLPVLASGALEGSFAARGTLGKPEPTGVLALRGVGVDVGGVPPVQAIDGTVRLTATEASLEDVSLRAAGHALKLRGKVKRDADGLATDSIRAQFADGGYVDLSARVGRSWFEDPVRALRESTELELGIHDLELASIGGYVGLARLAGKANGRVRYDSKVTKRADVELHAVATGLVPERADVVSLDCTARADERYVGVDKAVVGFGNEAVKGNLHWPGMTLARLLESPQAIVEAAVMSSFEIEDLDMTRFDPKMLGLSDLKGVVSGKLGVNGTLREPMPFAKIAIAGGTVRVPSGPRVEEIAGSFEILRDRVVIESVTATMGAGPVTLAGTFVCPGDLRAWQRGVVDLRVAGKDVLLHRRAGLKLRGDLDLRAQGEVERVAITGALELHSSKLVSRIPYFSLSRVGGVAANEGILLPGLDFGKKLDGTLDVKITTQEPVRVVSNLFKGDVNAALHLRGALATPFLEGAVSAPSGRLTLPGGTFRTSTALLRFEREDPRFPKLTLQAEGRRHGYEIRLTARGPYHEPEIMLSSTPALANEELIVLITTGARPSTLRQQGARGVGTVLGTYLAEELADYLFGSESTEARESFLDRFRLEFGTEISSNGTESALVEFRVTDRVFLQGERDVYEDINFGVVYRIRFK